MKNYLDVLNQLKIYGLKLNALIVDGRVHRVRANKQKEKSGWYLLHEMHLDDGSAIIVGTYGEWAGAESNTQKVLLDKKNFSREQLDAIKKRHTADKKRIECDNKRRHERCAKMAEYAWRKMAASGSCDYLQKKGIGAHGVKNLSGKTKSDKIKAYLMTKARNDVSERFKSRRMATNRKVL